MQLKLDELIRVDAGARNALIDLEELSEQRARRHRDRYEELARDARADLSGLVDSGTPEVGRATPPLDRNHVT